MKNDKKSQSRPVITLTTANPTPVDAFTTRDDIHHVAWDVGANSILLCMAHTMTDGPWRISHVMLLDQPNWRGVASGFRRDPKLRTLTTHERMSPSIQMLAAMMFGMLPSIVEQVAAATPDHIPMYQVSAPVLN